MTFASLIVVLFIFLLVGLLVMRPFLEDATPSVASASGRFNSLVAEKERLYRAIEELDLNLELHKISEEDYDRRRQQLLVNAAAVLEKLDGHPSSHGKARNTSRPQAGDDDLERLIAERRKALQADRGEFCPKCGAAVSGEDQFCSNCGAKL